MKSFVWYGVASSSVQKQFKITLSSPVALDDLILYHDDRGHYNVLLLVFRVVAMVVLNKHENEK